MPTPSENFDREQAESYDERWAALSPFNDSLHLQMGLVLEELPADARILCVGAGTGAEIFALAERFPGWSFLALDPSVPMLEVCRRKAEQRGLSGRCSFRVGYVHEIPDTVAPFDAATAILVSHFLVKRTERLRLFEEITKRVRTGGLLVTSDLCEAPRGQQGELMAIWLRMMILAGAKPEQIAAMQATYAEKVSMLSEEAMESLLMEAGFVKPTQFSQTLLIRSWFARRSS